MLISGRTRASDAPAGRCSSGSADPRISFIVEAARSHVWGRRRGLRVLLDPVGEIVQAIAAVQLREDYAYRGPSRFVSVEQELVKKLSIGRRTWIGHRRFIEIRRVLRAVHFRIHRLLEL